MVALGPSYTLLEASGLTGLRAKWQNPAISPNLTSLTVAETDPQLLATKIEGCTATLNLSIRLGAHRPACPYRREPEKYSLPSRP